MPPRTQDYDRSAGRLRLASLAVALLFAGALMLALVAAAAASDANLEPFPNEAGKAQTYSTTDTFDTTNPFFQSLGTNARSCGTCHQVSDGMSITPPHLQARFDATGGLDPVFRTVDGSNTPIADVSTVEARRRAYSMLLGKGLIRIGMGIPTNAEFTLVAVNDPYGYASAQELSLFRRPLPATNLRFESLVMWDGRETVLPIVPGNSAAQNLAALHADLLHQANDATLGHAQGARPLTVAQQQQIVAFELALFTAQVMDNNAGQLHAQGGHGGPTYVASQPFYSGINDPFGQNPTGAPFDPASFTLYERWATLHSSLSDPYTAPRAAVARGEALFHTKTFAITGVSGLNDTLGRPTIQGTCSTCHDTPSVGNHSTPLLLNVGTASAAHRTPDLPLYTLRCPGPTGFMMTTDPGRALITGKCADIGKFKVPVLRALETRSPYFHNGSADSLEAVLEFYDAFRFHIGFTDQEKSDLIAFLQTL